MYTSNLSEYLSNARVDIITDNGALAYKPLLNNIIHLDDIYLALITAVQNTEHRIEDSLETYMKDPDVQANLQQLQYDLQSWNLALTTMTNMQKNMADALNSIAANFR